MKILTPTLWVTDRFSQTENKIKNLKNVQAPPQSPPR